MFKNFKKNYPLSNTTEESHWTTIGLESIFFFFKFLVLFFGFFFPLVHFGMLNSKRKYCTLPPPHIITFL